MLVTRKRCKQALMTPHHREVSERLAGMQVPNQSLMTSDIVNVTQSRNLVDRLTFEVDVLEMKPELCEELAGRVLDMMNKEEPRRLSSTDFVPSSYIVGVTNPLKYTVRSHALHSHHHVAALMFCSGM